MFLLKNNNGISLIELVVSVTILVILASGIMPLAINTMKRSKEIELRRNLRIIRIAIDDYKKMNDIAKNNSEKNSEKFPESLDVLVKGHDFGSSAKSNIVKFLRRPVLNPLDPNSALDGNWGWGLQCYDDEYDSKIWCGKNVFNVYAPQDETSLDGKTKYSEW